MEFRELIMYMKTTHIKAYSNVLLDAVEKDDIELIHYLLEKILILILHSKLKNSMKTKLLNLVITKGNLEIIQLLLTCIEIWLNLINVIEHIKLGIKDFHTIKEFNVYNQLHKDSIDG